MIRAELQCHKFHSLNEFLEQKQGVQDLMVMDKVFWKSINIGAGKCGARRMDFYHEHVSV